MEPDLHVWRIGPRPHEHGTLANEDDDADEDDDEGKDNGEAADDGLMDKVLKERGSSDDGEGGVGTVDSSG